MGVWIEIRYYHKNMIYVEWVTPFMGVWIEIDGKMLAGVYSIVTPFMGVWIEIFLTV